MTSNNDYPGTPRTMNSGQDQTEEAARAAEALRQQVAEGAAKTHETAEQLHNRAEQGARQANEQLNQAISNAGQQLQSAARQVRQYAPEGQAATIAANAADLLDRGGSYLQSADTNTIATDLEYLIRRYPLQALAVGFGVGLLLGRRGK